MSKRKAAPEHWRNAIVRYELVGPSTLIPNELNWRVHPKEQTAALNGSLTELGWIAPVIVNETTQHVVDGHARIGEAIARNEPTVPVAYVRLTEAQERIALATFDPIAAMAGTDQAMLDELLAGLQVENQELVQFMATLTPTDPQAEWQGMPEFSQDDQLGGSAFQLIVHFKNLVDKAAFGALIGQALTEKTRYVWFPEEQPANGMASRWVDSES